MKKLKVKKDCFCEQYLYEKHKHPRPSLKEKKLKKGDEVEFVEDWWNFYGKYSRVSKGGVHYDMLEENLEKI